MFVTLFCICVRIQKPFKTVMNLTTPVQRLSFNHDASILAMSSHVSLLLIDYYCFFNYDEQSRLPTGLSLTKPCYIYIIIF